MTASPAETSRGAMASSCRQRGPPVMAVLLLFALLAGGASALAMSASEGPIRDFRLETVSHSDCDRVTFQVILHELQEEAALWAGEPAETEALKTRAAAAVASLVSMSEPGTDMHDFEVDVSLLDDSSDGKLLLDVNVDFAETRVGGSFAAGLRYSRAQAVEVLRGRVAPRLELGSPECKYMAPETDPLEVALFTGELSQQQLDVVLFTASLFRRSDVKDEKALVERYAVALRQLFIALGMHNQPQVAVQQSSRAREVTPFLDLPTRVTFANDPSGAQLLRSVIGLWGTATANRAAAIGPMAALESDSVLTTAVRAVTSQAHDLSRVRFTLLLPEFAGSLATEEEEAALGQTLMSFYHAALPAANIGTPYSVDLLWAEAAAEGDVQVGVGVQFLDSPNAANMLALSLSTNSSLIDVHAPPSLGALGYRDVSGHHSLSVLRFTAHLPGQNISELAPGALEASRLRYVAALRGLMEALSGGVQPASGGAAPSVRVIHIGDTCERLPGRRCGSALMLDTLVGMPDNAAGLHRLSRAITSPEWSVYMAGLEGGHLLEALQGAEFSHVAGGAMAPSAGGKQAAAVCFSTVMLNHGGLTAGIELKYSEWGKNFIERYKEALRSAARETGLGQLSSVEVLRIQGGAHPVVHTYVTLPSTVSASRLSATLQRGDESALAAKLEPIIGSSRFVDVSGTHMAHQVRFTAFLADMAEAHIDGFQEEYVSGLKAVVEDGGASVAPEVTVLHAERAEFGWAVDTALLFLDDRRAADDFVGAASALVPRALATSLGRVAVVDLTGNLEAQHISFSASLLDFHGSDLRGADLLKAGIFYRLLFSHWLADQQPDGFRRVLEPQVEVLHVDIKTQPSVTARVVLVDDAPLAAALVGSLRHRDDGRETLRLGTTQTAGTRREMREDDGRFDAGDSITDLDAKSSETSFYGFYGSDYSEQVAEIARRGASRHSRHHNHRRRRSTELRGSANDDSKHSEFYGFSGSSEQGDDSSSSARPRRARLVPASPAGIVDGSTTANLASRERPMGDRLDSGAVVSSRRTNMTVDFTAVLEDKRMSDISGSDVKTRELVEDFRTAIRSALQDLGLAPDTPTTVYVTDGSGERRLLQLTPSGEDEPAPELTVKGVYGRYDGIGVDARLVFGGRNAATTGLQFIEMLTTRPQAFAPAFKELGAVRFLFGAEAGHRASLDTPLLEPQMTVDETPVAAPTPADPPARAAPFPPLTDMQHCRHKDKHGQCCASPHALDATFECCRVAVDECGVCGGDSSSCAVSAVVRVLLPFNEQVVDKRSKEFASMVTDFKEGLGVLFSSWGVSPTLGIQVDRTMAEFRDVGIAKYRGSVEVDLPFTIYPHKGLPVVPGLRAMRTVLMTAAGERAEYKQLVMVALVDVYRQGVCGNGVCELGEMTNPLQARSNPGRCIADCRKLTCPVGTVRNLVGQSFVACSAKGECDEASGACECALGHSGSNCGICAEGYAPSGRDCVPIVLVGAKTSSSSGITTTDITVTVVSVVVVLLLMVALGCGVYALRASRLPKEGPLLQSSSPPRKPGPVERTLSSLRAASFRAEPSAHQQYLDSLTGCQSRDRLEMSEVRVEITPDIPRTIAQAQALREADAIAGMLSSFESSEREQRGTAELLREAGAHLESPRWRTRASEDVAGQPVEMEQPRSSHMGRGPSLPVRHRHSRTQSMFASPSPLSDMRRTTSSSIGSSIPEATPPDAAMTMSRQTQQPGEDEPVESPTLPMPPIGITLEGSY